jgi:xanthine dehydrogenase/oxidase
MKKLFKVAIECCKILNQNLEPIRQTMPEGYTWLQLVQKAFASGVDLTARKYNYVTDQKYSIAYNIYGAACSEAILDVLTGEYQLSRTDIMYDCGTRYMILL